MTPASDSASTKVPTQAAASDAPSCAHARNADNASRTSGRVSACSSGAGILRFSAPRVTRTDSGFHSVNALTGDADHVRQESQWQ
jgi:hypothetical protein